MFPPLTRMPPVPAGSPSSSAIQRTDCSSMSVPIGESPNDPQFGLTVAVSRSANAPRGAADEVM